MRKSFIWLLVVAPLIIIIAVVAITYQHRIFRNNIRAGSGEVFLYIPTGSDYGDVVQSLADQEIIKDTSSFRWVAEKKNYPNHVYPGRYYIPAGMNNNDLVNLLRSGSQEPVDVTFNYIRTLEKLAGVVASQLEADSTDLISLFRNREYLESLDMTRETLPGIFIPNTYRMYWNTNGEEFIDRMLTEYNAFWSARRDRKAASIDLDRMEVMTLASIVDEEALMLEEEARIAGVYMNRINSGMRLQADPTIKFAVGDMNIQRVLTKHLKIESPYNTYLHSGLPPGPITVPSISAIDAVLNHENHDYFYFCAKEDFSGYHNFAKSLAQHNKNARSYQKALDRRKILN